MDNEIWIAVKKYYDQLPEMPAEAQAELLENLETEEPQVAAILKSLIRETGDTDPALDSPAMSKIRETEQPTDLIGRQIGKYKLTYLIGIGGMGRVYLADRTDLEAHQQVAIKIISAGFQTEIYKKRFDRERKILSRLNHPHITRIYDGGISEDGTPYIIMEYVEGKPLLEYVADNQLLLSERLELFLDLCDAVDYAHRNFVMHRDLKPGNILVTNHGIVKVIDFGIAKILEDDESGEDLTIMGYIPLTPAYASPEQLKGQPLTVSSDIYSLGVILYELVTGNKPFPGSTKSNIALTERLHHTTSAVKPSTRINPSLTTDVKAWQKRVKGDIDNIVLKALKESPEERYGSADQLAEDIRRFGKNYPVSARPESVGYRFRKYAQRNRSLVALGVLLVIALTAGIAATLWQAEKAMEQRDHARYEAAKAQEITRFLTDLFAHSDPDQAKGDVITSETMLAHGSEKLGELAGQPSLQAEMYKVIGDLFRKQNRFGEAEAHLLQAMQIFEVHHGADDVDVARTKLLLAELYAFQNRTSETIGMSRDASRVFAESLGEKSIEYVKAQSYLARGEMQSANYQDALSILLSAAGIAETWKERNEDQSIALVSIYNDIGTAYNGLEQHSEYVRYLKKALNEIFRTKGELNQNVAALYNNLGHSYYFQNRYDSAEYYTLKALRIAAEVYNGKPNDRAQFAHCDLAKIYIETGRYDEALVHAEKCQSMAAEVYGDAHPAAARGLGVVGDVYMAKGDYESADTFRVKSTEMYEAFFDGSDPMLAWQYWDEADRYFRSGNLEKAIEYKRKCIGMYRETMPDAVLDIAEANHILANFLIDADSMEKVPLLLEESLELYTKNLGPDDERTVAVMSDLIDAYEQTKRTEDAVALRNRLATNGVIGQK